MYEGDPKSTFDGTGDYERIWIVIIVTKIIHPTITHKLDFTQQVVMMQVSVK